MPFEHLYFQQMEGGYPWSINGSTSAITNDSNIFYLDLGKSSGYADMILHDLDDPDNFTNQNTITGIEVIIEDAGTNSGANTSFDTELYNQTDLSYTDPITTTVSALTNPSTDDISVGGSTELWGTTWTYADIFHANFRVHLDNPLEPGSGIALMATFIYLKIYFENTNSGIIRLNSGLTQLTSGKITF